MRFTILPLALLTIASMASAADPAKDAKAPASATTGVASYYSDAYNGRITANRERFSNQALTAASRDLPLGSRVKITNLANKKSVIVKVNDRGPFVAGRDISVTRRAAQQLGFIKAGTANVSIEPVN